MPRNLDSSSDNQKENEFQRLPTKKRLYRSTTKDTSEEPQEGRSKRSAAIAAGKAITGSSIPQNYGKKSTNNFSKCLSADTASTTDGLPPELIDFSTSSTASSRAASLLTSSSGGSQQSRIQSSREASMEPPKLFDFSTSLSASSTAAALLTTSSVSSGSQQPNKSTKKAEPSIINESKDKIELCADGIVRIKFDNLNPIGPDNSSSDEEDEEEEFSTFNYLTVAEDTVEIPPIVPDDPSGEYEVERILLIRQLKKDTKYLLKWKNYPLNQMSWERKEKLIKCPKVLKNFEKRVELCRKIYDALPNKDEYQGYNDNYVTNIITPSFIQQNMFEEGIVEFLQNNNFGPLAIENWTRLTDILPKFTWVAENVFSYAASLAAEGFEEPKGCKCYDCKSDKCPCVQNTLTSYGYVRANMQNFIKECNKNCGCSSKCPSQHIQNGRSFPLMLFRTSKCGWSVRTMVPIPARKFVVEYVGLIRIVEECEDINPTYLFNCDLPEGAVKYVIDATEYGNESRFINHNCDPNLRAYTVLNYYSDPKLTRILFFSNRAIEAGEELTFNYFPYEIDLATIDPTTKRVCKCGAGDKCRKYLS